MDKLNLYICENFCTEFSKIAEQQEFEDVNIHAYPCMCEDKSKKKKTKALLERSMQLGDKGLVLCAKSCDVIPMVLDKPSFEVRATNYCFNHLSNEQFIQYILQKGGYIIGLGWLNHWREHIKTAGFKKDTARQFYQEFCKELVFFDAGIDQCAEKNLKELSEYLGLPYVMVPFEFKTLHLLFKSVVYGWRLHKHNHECEKSIAEIRSQCAEYSAILDLVGRISSYTNKRDTIEKIKEIFIILFGAKQFTFWSYEYENDRMPTEVKELFLCQDNSFFIHRQENRFCIKIEQNDKRYGAIDVGGFLFPQYIEKYLNFAMEIVKVCGLVLSNIEQYEKLIHSEKELQYLSFHDSLTGLYNRTYLNKMLKMDKDVKYLAVFMFDIDKLKMVNDHFGHAQGDKLICTAADILKKCFRITDTVARIGGDEFLAILPDCDVDMAETFRTRINECIKMHNQNVKEAHMQLSLSIGFAVSDSNIDTLENIMKKADQLMYVHKAGKRT